MWEGVRRKKGKEDCGWNVLYERRISKCNRIIK